MGALRKSSRSLSHLLMSSCYGFAFALVWLLLVNEDLYKGVNFKKNTLVGSINFRGMTRKITIM